MDVVAVINVEVVVCHFRGGVGTRAPISKAEIGAEL